MPWACLRQGTVSDFWLVPTDLSPLFFSGWIFWPNSCSVQAGQPLFQGSLASAPKPGSVTSYQGTEQSESAWHPSPITAARLSLNKRDWRSLTTKTSLHCHLKMCPPLGFTIKGFDLYQCLSYTDLEIRKTFLNCMTVCDSHFSIILFIYTPVAFVYFSNSFPNNIVLVLKSLLDRESAKVVIMAPSTSRSIFAKVGMKHRDLQKPDPWNSLLFALTSFGIKPCLKDLIMPISA